MRDPLDAAAVHPNFLTGRPYSDRFRDLAQMWSKLPMYAVATDVLQSLQDNRVTIIVSATGSGKGVITPRLLLKHFVLLQQQREQERAAAAGAGGSVVAAEDVGSWKVAITNPKKATTLKNAAFGAELLDVSLGQEVGFQFRGAPSNSTSPSTRLLYVTDGYLLAISHSDPLLSQFAGIILDEAHERPVPTDFLLSHLRTVLLQRPEFRLVIMSATIDPAIFEDYFRRGAGLSVRTIFAAGVTNYPVQRVFLKAAAGSRGSDAAENPLENAVRVLAKVLCSTDQPDRGGGNVLVFVPTANDALEGCRQLERATAAEASTAPGRQQQQQQRSASPVMPCTLVSVPHCGSLFSRQPIHVQQELTGPVPAPYRRRVIFATNIAESSFTLDDLDFVIDTGLAFHSDWDALLHGSVLSRRLASKAQVQQRVGRTGRTGPGTAYLMYTKQQFDKLPDFPAPAILSVDLTDDLMAILNSRTAKTAAAGSVSTALSTFRGLLTPPSEAQLCGAVAFLHFHRAIRVVHEGRREIHYTQVPYTSVGILDRVTHGAELTAFGRALHQLSLAAACSIWNALLLFSAIVHGHVRDVAVLVAIFEETGGESQRLWTSSATAPPSVPPPRAQLHHHIDPRSEHQTLINIFWSLSFNSDDSGDGGGRGDVSSSSSRRRSRSWFPSCCSPDMWWKVKVRHGRLVQVASRFRIRDLPSLLRDTPLLSAQALDTIQDRGSFRLTPLQKCLIGSRVYHHFAPKRRPPQQQHARGGAAAHAMTVFGNSLPLRTSADILPEFDFPLAQDALRSGGVYESLSIHVEEETRKTSTALAPGAMPRRVRPIVRTISALPSLEHLVV